MATVLVVDDRATNRELVRTLLGHHGHRVLEAGDGKEALAVVGGEPVDLVVTDVLMPGMDGYELVRELRERPDLASVPVVFYTANYLEHEAWPIAKACGVTRVVSKSTDPEVLLATLESVLAEDTPRRMPVAHEEFTREHLRAVNAKLVEKVRELEAKEEALHESEERFRRMAESSPVGILIADTAGTASYVNPRLTEILGLPAERLVGDGWLRCFSQEHRPPLRAAILSGAGSGIEDRHRVRIVRPDGAVRWIDMRFGITYDTDQRSNGCIGTVDDVTAAVEAAEQQQMLDARLRVAERLESLGRLAGGVAHDFNNLLSVILSYATFVGDAITEQMRDGHVPAEAGGAVVEDVDQIVRAGERAAQLTRQLLAFGGRDVVQPQVVDLNEVVREIQHLLAPTIGEHIEIVTRLDGNLRAVLADETQMGQVLLNLAVNARDAMPGGGTLVIETANLHVDADADAPTPKMPPGEYVRLTVSDTGHGMAPDVIDRALEPLFTTKPQGTGLGLATVYGVVTGAGGDLSIDSAPGKGTMMTVYLPVTEHSDETAEQASFTPTGGTETVLVVEDEAGVRGAAARILRAAGYRVLTAADGLEALAVADQHRLPVHLLLTDVIMPRMMGSELAERLRGLRPELRVLYMSGYAAALMGDQGALAPGIAMLRKPFSQADLLEAVRDVLDRR
jgi:PAS domain S-box-containing protein